MFCNICGCSRMVFFQKIQDISKLEHFCNESIKSHELSWWKMEEFTQTHNIENGIVCEMFPVWFFLAKSSLSLHLGLGCKQVEVEVWLKVELRGEKRRTITTIIIIIVTRPKPAYGRQGLAGSWGQDTDEMSTFLVFLTSHFAPAALSLDLTNMGP